ncbi:MAG TPA: hypothetical protein VK255_04555 [Patescibacteria group bacterium]|nr:hypothetical protein [Patescibacteria group bacterium]
MGKNTNKKNSKIDDKFISLAEAAKRSGYTPEHLNLSARKGNLEAKKIGRNWYTTSDWLEVFLSLKKKTEDDVKVTEDIELEKISETMTDSDNNQSPLEIISDLKLQIDSEREEKKTFKPFLFFGSRMKIAIGISILVITVPIIFFSVFSVKYFVMQKKANEEKIAMLNQTPSEVVMNETENIFSDETSEAKVLGVVSAEETTADPEAQKKSGTTLSSENFKAQNVSMGMGIILAGADENQPLEISDIRSESYITGKKNNANSKEEVKMVVSWKTNKPAISELNFSKNNGQDQKILKEQSFGFNHAVVLAQIDPRTSYVYQVKGKDRWGNQIDSDYYGIFTASKPVSVFDLITQQINEIFGWAIKQ